MFGARAHMQTESGAYYRYSFLRCYLMLYIQALPPPVPINEEGWPYLFMDSQHHSSLIPDRPITPGSEALENTRTVTRPANGLPRLEPSQLE